MVSIDLMDLADVGAQPRKLAAEIHRQLRAQFGDVPLPVPLVEIATALGIQEIIDRETDSYVGMLVTTPDRASGIIVLQAGLRTGRRNFTLGHEIGHFVNPYHKPPPAGFQCTRKDMAARRRGNIPWENRPKLDQIEVEANEFSIALSVPIPEYRRERLNLSGCDLKHLEALRHKFGLSREAIAQVYVDTAPEKIALIFSETGRIRRFVLPANFPYLGLSKGHPMPTRSLTASRLRTLSAGECSPIEEVSPDTWLTRSPSGVRVYEQLLVLSGGHAVTMLSVEEPDDEEQDEEAEVQRRWYSPQFGYKR